MGTPRQFHQFLLWFKVNGRIGNLIGVYFWRGCSLLDDQRSCAVQWTKTETSWTCLLKVGSMTTLYVSMVSCMLVFIFSGSANCVTGLYHAWRFGNRFFAFNCKKDQNNTANFSERTWFGVVKHFGAKCDAFKNVRLFWAECQRSFWNVLHLFSSTVPCKTLCPSPTFYNLQVPIAYCCVTWCKTRTPFSFLNSHFRWSFCGVILFHVAKVWAAESRAGWNFCPLPPRTRLAPVHF